jgi:PKHD-type hydroxylase
MAFVIPRAIPAAEVEKIRAITAGGSYGPGSTTAFGEAVRAKHNLQLATGSPAATQAAQMLVAALQANPIFLSAAWLDAMTTPLFCRYEPGMTYGDHIDAAMMGQPPMQMRCDIAVTVALVDAASYDGGELVMDVAGIPRRWKGDAGDCVLYAADTLHRVDPVTRGAREVAIFWIQTMVREEWQRRILFDLRDALSHLEGSSANHAHLEALRRTYYNLVRRWS